MPCDCNEEEERPKGLFRFTGGTQHKSVRKRGPYRSYETGKTYIMDMRHANTEAYPYWELVEGNIDTSAVEEKLEEERKATEEKSVGLQAFKPTLDPKDHFYAMSEEHLKIYITSNGGEVDGRWGHQRLVEEALKLQ